MKPIYANRSNQSNTCNQKQLFFKCIHKLVNIVVLHISLVIIAVSIIWQRSHFLNPDLCPGLFERKYLLFDAYSIKFDLFLIFFFIYFRNFTPSKRNSSANIGMNSASNSSKFVFSWIIRCLINLYAIYFWIILYLWLEN